MGNTAPVPAGQPATGIKLKSLFFVMGLPQLPTPARPGQTGSLLRFLPPRGLDPGRRQDFVPWVGLALSLRSERHLVSELCPPPPAPASVPRAPGFWSPRGAMDPRGEWGGTRAPGWASDHLVGAPQPQEPGSRPRRVGTAGARAVGRAWGLHVPLCRGRGGGLRQGDGGTQGRRTDRMWLEQCLYGGQTFGGSVLT